MVSTCLGGWARYLAVFALGVVLALPAAAQSTLGPSIVDAEFADGSACWQDSEFVFSAVNRNSGALQGPQVRTPIAAAPVWLTRNGPEPLLTRNGVECIGSALGGGIVRFGATGGAIVPGTDVLGLIATFPPPYLCDPPRYHVRDARGIPYLWREGQLTLLRVDGIALRWLSCEEILVWKDSRFRVLDLNSGQYTPVSEESLEITDAFPFTSRGGQRLIVITQGTRADLHSDNGGDGWQVIRSLTSPDPAYPYLKSLELFDWQGRVFMVGMISVGSGFSRSKIFVHDFDRGAWRQIGDKKSFYMDPEVLVLDNGNLAVYFIVPGEGTTKYVVFKP